MQRLHRDIASSRRMGRIALGVATLLGILVAFTLAQGIWIALRTGRNELLLGAGFGILLLLGAGCYVSWLGLQQKRLLDAAQHDLDSLEKDWAQTFVDDEPDV